MEWIKRTFPRRTAGFQNIFILCTGRCGSTTFIHAAQHITNFTAGHETRTHMTGDDRLRYAPRHIEADNRLAWMLGRLHETYGDDAFYVHLTRNPDEVIESFAARADRGIMKAYRENILMRSGRRNKISNDVDFAQDYVETVTTNINFFLQNKTHKMQITLENAKDDFATFWGKVGAVGHLDHAVAEWDTAHNARLVS